MAVPRLGLWVGAGLLAASTALAQGGDAPPPGTATPAPSGTEGTGAPPSDAPRPGPQPVAPAASGPAPASGAPTEPAPTAGPGATAGAEPSTAAEPATASESATARDAAELPVAEAPRQFPFVTLDQARLFNQSLYGARLIAELGLRQSALAAENRRIEAELADKEKALTDLRAGLAAEEFRRLADVFNAEVERHRSEQAAKEREIYQHHERNRALFQDLANQAMAGLLRERGALAIIAEEAIVLGFRDLDITLDAIARLDALVGDGAALPQPGSSAPGPAAPVPEGAGEEAAPPAPEGSGNQTPDRTSD